MPFPFTIPSPTHRRTKNPFTRAIDNPWAPRPTPTDELRHNFHSFCALENEFRASRGEQPFCTPATRDRAFEKLMQLSRGEGVFHWEIAPVEEDEYGYGLGKYGYGHAGRFGGDWEEAQMQMEMQRVKDEREVREWREGDVQRSQGKEECERKDSKGVGEQDDVGNPMRYVFGDSKGKEKRVEREEWVEIDTNRFVDKDDGSVFIEDIDKVQGREVIMDVDGDDGPVYIEKVSRGR